MDAMEARIKELEAELRKQKVWKITPVTTMDGSNMTVNELIKKIKKLKEQGYGENGIVLPSCGGLDVVNYGSVAPVTK